VHQAVADVVKTLPLEVQALNDQVPGGRQVLQPRVGLYKSHVAAMDEGWTRWILEQWGLPYASLDDPAVRAGNLRQKYDAIVLPDQGANSIVNGWRPGTMPEEYVGGIGQEGVTALKTFVEQGGTLVALDSASLLAVEQFGLPVRNVLSGLSGSERGEEAAQPAARESAPRAAAAQSTGRDRLGPDSAAFYAPGSIVRTRVDVSHPVAYGSAPEGIAWFEQSPAFEVNGNARAIVTYPAAGSPLLSGWLLGGDKLNGRAAVVEAPLGGGRVILFGFRPQYRAQTWATFKLFFNALYYSTMDAKPATRTEH
jgi:hypothetical protein